MSDNYRERACTCDPSEAPKPCPQRYAYSECVLAAENERLKAANGKATLNFIYCVDRLRAEIERLRAALESLTKDPPATLDEPDPDWEVITKMRAIARCAFDGEKG